MDSLDLARGQLRNLALDNMRRLDVFLGVADEDVPLMIDAVSRELVDRMAMNNQFTDDGTAQQLAESAALRALRLVVPLEPEFWLTDLGRLIAFRVGYGQAVAPRPHVAMILGISKQAVAQQLTRGRLTAAGTSGVTNESLVRRLREVGQKA